MGIDWQIVAFGLAGLCPIAGLLGIVAGILAVNGVRRPRLESYSVERVAAEDAPMIVQRELDRGARLVRTSHNIPGIINLHFVEWRK